MTQPETHERTDLDRALHAALDGRRDPLADDAVLRALEGEPEGFARVLRAADDAALLQGTGGRKRSRRAPWIAVAVAAASVAAAIVVANGARPGSPGATDAPERAPLEPLVQTPLAAAPVQSLRSPDVRELVCTIESEGVLGRSTTTLRSRPDGTSTLERSIREVAPDGTVLELTTLRTLR